jgi:type III secretion protein HrpB1
VTALLAVCLSSLGDAGWRVYANEVLARDEDAESVGLMNLLTGQRPKGEPLEKEAPGASAATADLLRQAMSFSYLRA